MKKNKIEKEAALNNLFQPYLKVGELDDLTAGGQKDCATYYAPIEPASFNSSDDIFQASSLIVKELDDERIPIYTVLSENWNPYLETVFGLINIEDTIYSLNECVQPPDLPELKTAGISLALDDYIEHYRNGAPFTETEALIFLYELCEGLKDLHKQNVFHGDISPQNILLTDASFFMDSRFQNVEGIHHKIAPKIIDFGNAKKNKSQNHEVTTAIGTKPYASPDILDFHHPVDQRADIYSLGCVLGFMLTGISPKEGNIRAKVSRKVWKIIEKCTDSYHERFSNVSALQRRILKELNYSSTATESIIRSIPGFRSHNYVKMAVACYFYFAFFIGSISLVAAHAFLTAFVMLLLFLISIVSLFDVFHLMDLVKKHCYFFKKHTKTAFVVRISVALCIIYAACMIFGGYL